MPDPPTLAGAGERASIPLRKPAGWPGKPLADAAAKLVDGPGDPAVGPVVPPAIEAIAWGVADALGGAG